MALTSAILRLRPPRRSGVTGWRRYGVLVDAYLAGMVVEDHEWKAGRPPEWIEEA